MNKLIGKHPEKPDFFAEWLNVEDTIPVNNPNKKHRKLTEIDGQRNIAIEQIANWLVEHLITDRYIKILRKRKKEIYEKYDYEIFLKSQKLLPEEGTTVRQGNFAEIIFIEYLKSLKKYDFLVYKLQYTTNVSQAMKGDDILMFDKSNLRKILIGESKYRTNVSKDSIEEILESFGGSIKLPISMTFVINHSENLEIATELSEIQAEIENGLNSIINAGLILSNEEIHKTVENHSFYGDFSLTQTVIDELLIECPNYPVDSIKKLIGLVFKNQTLLRQEIQKNIARYEMGDTEEEKKKKAKNWVTKKYKTIIFEHSSKKINSSLLFISLGLNDLDIYLSQAFDLAEKLLHNPELLETKTP